MNSSPSKPVQSIVLDAGPILKNDPSTSSLLAKSERIFTIPLVLSEIRDAQTRARVENTLVPFLTIRNPNASSIKVITDFARRTGDLAVLSSTDVSVIALTYELECERNGGDWRLRRVPGQKGINGPVPRKFESENPEDITAGEVKEAEGMAIPTSEAEPVSVTLPANAESSLQSDPTTKHTEDDELSIAMKSLGTTDHGLIRADNHIQDMRNEALTASADHMESSDSEGWITPSNLIKHQSKDLHGETAGLPTDKTMQVATITTDFAMQNVLLQMGLNLLSPAIQQVRHIKTFILRCHACFQKTKDMSKQFCPSCGQPTLTRVSCSTNAKGEFQMHLKKNMQWSHRGDRYSIPKPVSGTASGKVGASKKGGKGGWGQGLILAEDQKEYVRAMQGESRRREKNLMDEDYLPSILTGDRSRAGGRPKIGAGRNINSKKR